MESNIDVFFCGFVLQHLSKQVVEYGDFSVSFEMELECRTSISLELKDAVLDTI